MNVSLITDGTFKELEEEIKNNFEIDPKSSYVVLLLKDFNKIKHFINHYYYYYSCFFVKINCTKGFTNFIRNKKIVVFYNRMFDPCLHSFRFRFFNKTIAHVDIRLQCGTINLNNEFIEEMFFLHKIIGHHNFEHMKLRISKNNSSIHANGFNKMKNFTCSIFISKLNEKNSFVKHNVCVITNDGETYNLKSTDDVTYYERFGTSVSIQIQKKNFDKQKKYLCSLETVISKIKTVTGFIMH